MPPTLRRRDEGQVLATLHACLIEADLADKWIDREAFARIIARHLQLSANGTRNLLMNGRDVGYWELPDARIRRVRHALTGEDILWMRISPAQHAPQVRNHGPTVHAA